MNFRILMWGNGHAKTEKKLNFFMLHNTPKPRCHGVVGGLWLLICSFFNELYTLQSVHSFLITNKKKI